MTYSDCFVFQGLVEVFGFVVGCVLAIGIDIRHAILLPLAEVNLPVKEDWLQALVLVLVTPRLNAYDLIDHEDALRDGPLHRIPVARSLVVLAAHVWPDVIRDCLGALLVAAKEMRNGLAQRRVQVAGMAVLALGRKTVVYQGPDPVGDRLAVGCLDLLGRWVHGVHRAVAGGGAGQHTVLGGAFLLDVLHAG